MKINLLIINVTIGLFPLMGIAKTDLNLSIEANANYQERRHFKHSMKCYWKKKAPETHSHGTKTISNKLVSSIGWNTNAGVKATSSYKYNYDLAEINLNTQKVDLGNGIKYSITLDSKLNGSRKQKYETNSCNHRDMTVSPANANVSGSIVSNFDFYSKSWLTEIKDLNKTGIFTSSGLTFFEEAINAKFFIADNSFYIWARPGSKLSVKIDLAKTAFSNERLGSIDFRLIPVKNTEISGIEDTITSLNSAISLFRKGKLERAFLHMAQVVSTIKSDDQMVKQMETSYLFEVTEELYQLAHSIEGDAEDLVNAKTMAAFLSYELTMQLFRQLEPYCGQIEVDSVFSDSSNSVLGVRAAHFWTYRALLALKYFEYSALDSLLERMVDFELNERTYAEVMDDSELQTDLDQAYNLLLESFDFSASPFSRAKLDVERLTKYFPSIGASDTNSEALLNNLSVGSSKEGDFMTQLHKNFYNYKKRSSEKILITPIIESKKELDLLRKDIIEKMLTQIRFLSVKDGKQNDFMAKVTRGLLHQVNVFNSTSEIEMIENIRQYFIKSEKKQNTIETMQNCIFGESYED